MKLRKMKTPFCKLIVKKENAREKQKKNKKRKDKNYYFQCICTIEFTKKKKMNIL